MINRFLGKVRQFVGVHLARIIGTTLSLVLLVAIYYTVAAYGINQHFVWNPNIGGGSGSWSTGATKGYAEGDVAVFGIELTSLANDVVTDFGICLDLDISGEFAFTEFVAPSQATFPPICSIIGATGGSCGAGGWTPGDPDWDTEFFVWGENIDITSAVYDGRGPGPPDCKTGQIRTRVSFVAGTGSGAIYYAGRLAAANAPYDETGDGFTDGFVPEGFGAASVNGTFNATLEAANKTVVMSSNDIDPIEFDLGVVKTCPADFSTGASTFTFVVDVTNYGPDPVAISSASFTDTYDSAELTWNNGVGDATFSYNTSAAPGTFNPGSGTCTDAALVAGTTYEFSCTPTAPSPFLEVGQTVRVQLEMEVAVESLITNQVEVVDSPAASPDPEEPDLSSCTETTPVSVSYMSAATKDGVTRFDWQTANELGNVGFNVYVKTEDGLKKINEDIIPSQLIDSLSPQDYVYEADGINGEEFYIEDVSLDLQTRRFGPFTTEEAVGRRVTAEPIDWAAIKAEQEQPVARPILREAGILGNSLSEQTNQLSSPQGGGRGGRGNGSLAAALIDEHVRIKLSTEGAGLYRVTYEDLLAAGFDLAGTKTDRLALLNDGEPVPMRVEAVNSFGSGGFIEFWAEEVDTIYTGTNVYTLTVDLEKALRVAQDSSAAIAEPESYYLEEVSLGEQTGGYSALTAIDDPWFDTQFFTRNGNSTPRSYQIPVDNLVAGGAAATLSVDLWGRSSWADVYPDHHVQIDLNGEEVQDLHFDGTSDASFDAPVATNALVNGNNQLTIRHLGDTGADFSFVFLDSYGLRYPRAFVARNGALIFDAQGAAFEVSNLPSNDVVVYRVVDGIHKMLSIFLVTSANGKYAAKFAGSANMATYVVSTATALKQPAAITAGRRLVNITSGQYDYVIISHRAFIKELGPLVSAHEAQGLDVLVVDVDDVYEQFAGGVFGAEAIEEYVAYAVQNMGARYFLLVGGDTYDYRGYAGGGSISFIPSPFAKVGAIGDIAPADPLYFDLNKDGVPDVAHGRFPVRSSQELAWLINKTLTYQENVKDDGFGTYYGERAIFTADKGFKPSSEAFVSLLDGWDVERIYLDDLAPDEAHAKLMADIETGSAVTSFIGHSSATSWARTTLLTSSEAKSLENSGKPTVVTQWGCSNSYYVDPSYNTMSHSFLVSGDAGAAAVLGATALSNGSSEELLGRQLTPLLVEPGRTIGDAMLEAKTAVGDAKVPADYVDVLLGWTLLGDPALMVQP